MQDFNQDQQDFVGSMSRGFMKDRNYSAEGYTVLIGLGILIVALVLLYIAYQNRYRLKGYVVFLWKALKGKPTAAPRLKKVFEVVLQLPLGDNPTYHTTTTNLSAGGMFIKMPVPIPAGQLFNFHLYLPDNETYRGRAEVMWVQPTWSEHHPAGMGCKFIHLKEGDRNKIKLALRKELKAKK